MREHVWVVMLGENWEGSRIEGIYHNRLRAISFVDINHADFEVVRSDGPGGSVHYRKGCEWIAVRPYPVQ